MSNASIKVSFSLGTEFRQSVIEARRIARILDLAYVQYDFNEVKVYIGQSADIEKAREQYDICIKNKAVIAY
jgi:hypothetical protein